MTISARPKDDVEKRLEDMLVAWLKEQIPVRGVTANIRRKRDTTASREMPAFITEINVTEAPLIRLPQYINVVRIHCQTQADKSSTYAGDGDMTDCTKMLGVIRDALYRTQTINDFNRLADGIVVHPDGWRETQTIDESEGSVNDLAIELEIACYIP